jgi:[DsrC]-trisulfide reductase subunit J
MSLRRYAIAAGAVAFASVFVLTDASGDVPYPDIARGQGESCVADTDFMRRNHMSLLMHQRDDTMRKGIRSKQYSLKECLACHAVAGPDAIPVTVEDPKHFCRSCHDYAAVKIDCFQCHASRPEQTVVAEAEDE